MKINLEAVADLVKKNFRDNKSWFADELGMDISYVNQILNNKRNLSSPKMCNAIIEYCNNNKLDYKNYIFL